MSEKSTLVKPSMTVLDVVTTYRGIEGAFKKYDDQIGICICCQALFEPLEKVAAQYDLDLNLMLGDLSDAASEIIDQQ